jgi:DNA-binding SARP family transcriptional activator
MEVSVLGPLEAQENGRSVVPTAGKLRQILALLALEAGQVVTVPTLIEELWRMEPPRSALTTLQTYILQLRRMIEAALAPGGSRDAKDVLVTRSGGYLLNVHDGVDVQRYDRLAAAGTRAAENADFESASRLLRSALDVWRGQALADVPLGLRLGIETIRLEESRMGVRKLCIDADLQLGRHYTLLSELAKLNASFPMHENLCAQFMVALYRSGQQWRAIDAYKRLRETLVDELGLEPSARLQQLQRAILRSDPALNETPIRELLRERLAAI